MDLVRDIDHFANRRGLHPHSRGIGAGGGKCEGVSDCQLREIESNSINRLANDRVFEGVQRDGHRRVRVDPLEDRAGVLKASNLGQMV